jgi:hypothetical protein
MKQSQIQAEYITFFNITFLETINKLLLDTNSMHLETSNTIASQKRLICYIRNNIG